MPRYKNKNKRRLIKYFKYTYDLFCKNVIVYYFINNKKNQFKSEIDQKGEKYKNTISIILFYGYRKKCIAIICRFIFDQ